MPSALREPLLSLLSCTLSMAVARVERRFRSQSRGFLLAACRFRVAAFRGSGPDLPPIWPARRVRVAAALACAFSKFARLLEGIRRRASGFVQPGFVDVILSVRARRASGLPPRGVLLGASARAGRSGWLLGIASGANARGTNGRERLPERRFSCSIAIARAPVERASRLGTTRVPPSGTRLESAVERIVRVTARVARESVCRGWPVALRALSLRARDALVRAPCEVARAWQNASSCRRGGPAANFRPSRMSRRGRLSGNFPSFSRRDELSAPDQRPV